MRMRNLLVGAIAIGLMGGTVAVEAKKKRERLPPKGSTIVLNQAVKTDFDSARVYIQFGKAVSKKDLKEFYPTCYFYLKTLNQGGTQTLKPASFTIKRSANYTRQGFGAAPGRWQMAGSSLAGLRLAQGGDYYKMSDMKLEPNPQEVLSLTCYLRYAYGTAITPFLFLDEIEKVLGDVASIEPATKQ
jgi:hypothetical protein